MAVVLESVSTESFQFLNNGDLTITKPSGLAVGELMIAHLSACDDSPASNSSFGAGEWTELENFVSTNSTINECRIQVFYKVADSDDVAATDFSFTLTDAANCAGSIYRISGHGNLDANSAGAVQDSTPTFANTITPAAANSLILFLVTAVGDSGSGGSVANYAITTDNPTWTEQYDITGNAGPNDSDGTHAGASATRSQTTATGDSTCTLTTLFEASAGTLVYITAVENATANPAVVSVAASAQAPTVTGSATASPTVFSVAANIISPAVTVPTPDWDNVESTSAPTIDNVESSDAPSVDNIEASADPSISNVLKT